MLPHQDLHLHTHYLKCANATMTIPAIIAKARELGQTAIGITDHLNQIDKLPLHREILRDLKEVEHPGIDIYFGVELNYMGCDGDFAWSEEIRDDLGFQFSIGGIHSTYMSEYDPKNLVDIQHRHHLATCQNPLVDVLVHPYWFGKYEFDRRDWPWFDSMKLVPKAYARELGQVAKETGTAVEINGGANIENANLPPSYVDEYAEYLAEIAAQGCQFTVASDAHDINRMDTAISARKMADRIGLTADRLWSPSVPPLIPA